ncbi:MAG: hypothetical protein KKF00_04240 [Proteobacteria bacterium]|nr:hypothetical protein [Pseudomonadota bacterium]
MNKKSKYIVHGESESEMAKKLGIEETEAIIWENMEIGELKYIFNGFPLKMINRPEMDIILSKMQIAIENQILLAKKCIEEYLKYTTDREFGDVEYFFNNIGGHAVLRYISPLLPKEGDWTERYIMDDPANFYAMIEKMGPISLSLPVSQRILEQWLKEGMTKTHFSHIVTSLIEYGKKKYGHKNIKAKPGRKPDPSTQKMSAKATKELYTFLHTLFNYIKKKSRYSDDKKMIESTIEYYGRNALRDKVIFDWLDDETRRIVLEKSRLFNPIISIIWEDEELKNNFMQLNWVPHEVALTVAARLTKRSVDTIRKIIYRK